MKRKLLFLLGGAFLGGLFSLNLSAQTDVTSTYLTNPGFDDGETGWTFNCSGTTYHGVAAYGSSTAINSATNINVDKFGKNNGNAAFSNAGWGDKSYYTQEVTLPAGSYKLTFDVINRFADKTGINANYFGWVPNNGDAVYSSTKTFEYNVWYTLSVTFTLSESTTGKISCGMQSTSGSGSGAVAKLFIDNVKIFKTDEASAPSIAKPIDYSDLINQTTWSVQQDDNATPITSSALVTNITSGDWTGRYVERYRGVAGHYGKALYQTVSVPAGVYQVQAACMSSSANNVDPDHTDGDVDVAFFYANSEKLTYPLSDKKGYYRKHIVTLDADGTIEFGINTKVVGANWNAIGCATVIKVANDYDSYIEDLLSESIAAWNTAHTALDALDETALPDAAESAITTELAKARPNTQEAIESATAALQALIDSYDGIKAAFDEYKALKATVEDLKNTSKYTFTGDDALSTFNSTLSTIDGNAEAATDAATLTALLPSLKTAGNTFVGAIESNDGFDLTYNIENNSFETGVLSPWTTNGSNDTGVRENSNGTYKTTGVDGDYLFNTWDNNAGSKVRQTLSSLPKGYYTVTVLVASDAGNTINILAGATTKGIESDATDGKTKFVEGTTDKTLVSDGSLEIGTNSSTWYKSDYFRLTYFTEKAGAAEAWAVAKAAAEAARDDAAYKNVTGSEKTDLLAEIAKEEPTTAEAYGTATTALQVATSAFIAAKDSYDGLVAMRTTGVTYTTEAWPRATAAKKTALDDAVAAEPTNAADAVTKTNAIVTAYRQFVESNGLAEGVDVAVNYTSTYLADADPDVNTDWTNGIGVDRRDTDVYTKGDGTTSGKYYDGGWSNSAAVSINMTRELTLPEGQYQLQITARGSSALTSYTMSIGGEKVNLPSEGADAATGTFGHGWSDRFVVFNSDGTTPLTLAIAATSTENQQWISFNRLRLMKLDATLANATDYSNLNNAIAAAEANLGFESGQNAPYNNKEAIALLLAAKAIDQTVNNVQGDVQAATTALNSATWTANIEDVDAIYNGMFATVAEGQNYPDGWTRTNGWGQMQSGLSGGYATAYYNQPGSLVYGGTGVYTMPLAANTYYKITLVYRSHENNSNNGITVTVQKGEDVVVEKVLSDNPSKTEWKKGFVGFKTGAAGNHVLTLANNGNTWMTGVSLVKVDPETVTMTITDAQYATFIAPFDVTIPTGVIAKKLTMVNSDNTLAEEDVTTTIPANTPVVLHSESVVNETFTDVAINESNEYTVGVLTGVYGEITAPNNSYILNKLNDGWVGFAKVASDNESDANPLMVGANRCYIKADAVVTPAPFFRLGGTTNIANVENAEADAAVYDLTGRRVDAPAKGIYIVNGKKVLVK